MTDLKSLLIKAGVEKMSLILGQEAMGLLAALDPRSVNATRLADLLLKQLGPEALLLDVKNRDLLLPSLSPGEANELCVVLGLKPSESPWVGLCKTKFPRSHARTEKLFDYFGCRLAPLEASEEEISVSVVNSNYPLFSHQRKLLSELSSQLAEKPFRVLMHMPTGAGKTRSAMNVVAEILRSATGGRDLVVWLAHSEELCDQAADEFSRAWGCLGNRDVNLYRFYSGREVELAKTENGIIIAGLSKLYQRSLNEVRAFFAMGKRVRLVVMDEAHQAVAPTYQHLLNILAPDDETKILGLSATPGRSFLDAGEDLKLAEFFYHKKTKLQVAGFKSPLEYLYREGYLARPEFITIPYQPAHEFPLGLLSRIKDELDIPSEIISQLEHEEQRNLLILSQVCIEARSNENKIIVFGCSVEHAHLMASILNVRGINAAAITGKTPLMQRAALVREFKEGNKLNVLTNFGVLTTGFDAPRANVAVIARPTQSVVLYSQMIGRVSRGKRVGGNDACRIVTVHDQIPGIKNMGEAFGFWEDIW